MAKILFSSQPEFLPIIRALQVDGHEIISLHGQFVQQLLDLDVKAIGLGHYAGGLQDLAFKEAARIIRIAGSPFSTNGLEGKPYEFMTNDIAGFLYPRLADLVLLAICLNKARPDLIILHNDVEPMTRITALWARVNGKPCLHVPHAVYQDVNRSRPGSDIHDLITASHLAVAGPFQRQWYERVGAAPGRIKETGLPQFDKCTRPKIDRERARRLLKLNQYKPVIVYGSTWPQNTNALGCNDEWAAAYIEFLEATKELPGAQVVVKCHPRAGDQSLSWHAQQAKAHQVECVVTAQHLEVCLSAADAVLVYGGSNMLLEASFIPGLRLLTIHGYDGDPEVNQAGPEAGDIAAAIKEVLSVPSMDMRQFQARYIGIPDGRAHERVTAYARELLG